VVLSTGWLAVTAPAIFIAAPFALDALRRAFVAARRLFENATSQPTVAAWSRISPE